MKTFGFRIKCEAEPGLNVFEFAEQLVEHRKKVVYDIVAVFNDIYFEVTADTTSDEIVKFLIKKI